MENVVISKTKMMIIMRRDLKMSKGKIASQAGHACVGIILKALKKENLLYDYEESLETIVLKDNEQRNSSLINWFQYGCTKVCVYVDSEAELLDISKKATERGVLSTIITDAGVTEFHGVPTKTCLALEPLSYDIADELTGHLKLY